MQLTYNEIVDILDVKCSPTSPIGFTFPPGIYEINDIDLMIKGSLPDEVKVNDTIDDIRLKSNSNINQTLIFTKKFFLHNFRIYSITFLSYRRNRWILWIDCGILYKQ